MSQTTASERAYPNVGAGTDPYRLTDAFDDADRLVLLLQRDYYCQVCKRQTKRFAERYDEFAERNAEVVVVVPDPPDKVEGWARDIEPPFPLLADDDAALGDEYDQRVRFGVLGELHDAIGRMPEAVVLSHDGEMNVEHVHSGGSYFDRPSVDELLEKVDDA
jgi:peroxiredoxin Q/BCP